MKGGQIELVIRIQPKESIYLKINKKVKQSVALCERGQESQSFY